jgi:hypothetical protein
MRSNPVNGNGAFGDEMNEAALFMDALRAAVPNQPDSRLAVTLVPRLASTARSATLEAETRQTRRAATTAPVARRPRSRRALVARVGIAVALIPLVLAGLAVAGVTVPSPARSAFDSIGIDLPNQPDDRGDQGESAPSSQPPSQDTGTQGTDGIGRSNAQDKGNSKAAHEHAREQRTKAKGNAFGHDRGKAIGLNDLVPPGHSGDTGPPAHSNAGGSSGGSSAGKTKSQPTPAPRGNAKGHTKIPPGQAKK